MSRSDQQGVAWLAGFLPAVFVLGCAVPTDTTPPARPNVLVIVADDLGIRDLGAYDDLDPEGRRCFYETPNLDRLAREGVRFTNAYAACPVCSPSRYALLTGRYPIRGQATNWFSGKRAGRFLPAESADRMPLEEVTIAEALKPHGYATFFAGKWHLGPTEDFWPEAQGFDVNRGGYVRGGPYGGKKYFSPYGNPRLEDGPDGEHLPDRLASETLAFVDAQRDAPWLAYLSFYSVHTPLMAPDDLVAKARARRPAGDAPRFAQEEQTLPTNAPRRVRIVQDHAVYAAMVEAMDRAVGKVLDGLAARGLADDTLVIFTSDNGGLSTSEGLPTSNLPFRGGKGWTYEGGIREPFLVRWPSRMRGGREVAAPVCGIDVFPTVLDACGIAVPNDLVLDGVSVLAGETNENRPLRTSPAPQDAERPLFWHYPHYGNQGGFPSGAVRLGDWKLIYLYEDCRHHRDLHSIPTRRTSDLA
ncbi:MAG: sulfatase, partial [Planctomycetes bacterium]|nr:sulfatase [Planctomycetota bacterium]